MSIYVPTGNPVFNSAMGSKQIRDEFALVQTAVNSKADAASPVLTGTPTLNGVSITATAAEINKLAGTPAGLTSTELGYVDGVTSAIQTQLNAKAPTDSPTFTGTVTYPPAGITSTALAPGLSLIGPTADNIKLTGSASADVNTLDYYEEGTYTATLTGMTTVVTTAMRYTRIGKVVTLTSPVAVSGISNSASFLITGMPASLRPSANMLVCVYTINNGTGFMGAALVDTTGDFTFLGPSNIATGVLGGFTASGNKGINGIAVSYVI